MNGVAGCHSNHFEQSKSVQSYIIDLSSPYLNITFWVRLSLSGHLKGEFDSCLISDYQRKIRTDFFMNAIIGA